MRRISYQKIRSVRQGRLELPSLPCADHRALERLREFTEQYILDEEQRRSRLAQLADVIAGYAAQPFCIEPDRVSFLLRQPLDLPVLPPAYGYKGGAARYLLAATLNNGWSTRPRDLDLVRVGRGWTNEDTVLSREYMLEDFEKGHGVEVVQSLPRYFSSRDVSVNEVIYRNGLLMVSTVGLLDFAGLMLRPCFYRGGTLHREPSLRGRIFLKMLRLAAIAITERQPIAASGITADLEVTDFDLAIELDKAFAHGIETAERFAVLLREAGFLEEAAQQSPLQQLLDDIIPGLFGGLGFFRNLPEELKG